MRVNTRLNWVEAVLTAGADAQTVWFRVADRGIGIRPEHVERAFERFWQLETGDQRTRGGVGLGLYLVRRIVERQHGWVSLRPRQGGGTVAEVRLPTRRRRYPRGGLRGCPTTVAERAWCVVVAASRSRRTRRPPPPCRMNSTRCSPRIASTDAVAIAAELVGNAVRHAAPLPGDVIRVAWRLLDDDTLEIRVDRRRLGRSGPELRVAAPEAIDGRGLTIVAALATGWGVERDGLGQCVWATLCPGRPCPL